MAKNKIQKKKDWEVKKLGDLGDIFNGNSINAQYKKDNYLGLKDGLKFIATKDVSFNHKINYENGVKIPFNEKDNFRVAKKGSVLICAEGGSSGRKMGIVNENVTFGNKLFAFESRGSILEKFVFYFYLTEKFQKDFVLRRTGLIGGVSIKKFKEIKISFPKSLTEQKRIVKILDEVFENIEKAKENAEKNLENTKELFESYLQGVFENKDGDWEEKKLGDLGFLQTGTTPKTSEKENLGDFIPFVKPADFYKNGFLNYKNFGLSEKGSKKSRIIDKNSVLMVCIGATIGKTGFSIKEITCNQQINTFTVDPIKNCFKFFYYAMITKKFQKSVIFNSRQSTLPIINKTKWSKLKVAYPKSLKTQKQIVKKLDELSEKVGEMEAILRSKIADLDELKKSVLKKAFDGEL
ncbi:MAG: restriction endonuclease subunit S [Candidatus Pacebacteria bacterium]|nr:restriction endonuclease subunit S [Candidatus Paceibacterota bacterium]